MLHAVIMAGGSGTRFWPASRMGRPKQLLALSGDRTMLQATVDRLGGTIPPERLRIATTALLARPIAEQLPEVNEDAILIEPCKRDTAPAIGLAAVHLLRDDPDAVMAVMPSDHVIRPPEAFREALEYAHALVRDDPSRLITFGIVPTYPAESFGYIERAEPLEPPEAGPKTFAVARFREKPKADVAAEYVGSGRFYWNAGIFVWRARTILDELANSRPTLAKRLGRIAESIATPDYQSVLEHEFAAIEPISIDFGVMEHAKNVVVIEAPFEWDDLGSWRALERLRAPDESGNVVDAAHCLAVDTSRSIIRCDDPDHVVVTLGVDDLIVIVTSGATLIADKTKEESIRRVTKLLEEQGLAEYL